MNRNYLIAGSITVVVATIFLTQIPSLIAQYDSYSNSRTTQDAEVVQTKSLEETCKDLKIVVPFYCTESAVIGKYLSLKGDYGRDVSPCTPSDLNCRISKLEQDVKMLKDRTAPPDERSYGPIAVSSAKVVVFGEGKAKAVFDLTNPNNEEITISGIALRALPLVSEPFTLQPNEVRHLEIEIVPERVFQTDIFLNDFGENDIGSSVSLTVRSGQFTTVTAIPIVSS